MLRRSRKNCPILALGEHDVILIKRKDLIYTKQ